MLIAGSAIYRIDCLPTGKVYVGSAVNLYRRWHAHHLPSLRRGTHCNRYLQNAWTKHGEANFTISVVERVADVADLITREQHWIDTLDSANPVHGFNLCCQAASSLGCKQTQEAKDAIAAANCQEYLVRDPDGNEQVIRNLSKFCRDHGLTSQAMLAVARGKKSHHKEWECRRIGVSREEWLASLYAPPKKLATMIGDQKRCSKCKTYLPRSSFFSDSRTVTGLSAYCRDCKRPMSATVYRRRAARTEEAC